MLVPQLKDCHGLGLVKPTLLQQMDATRSRVPPQPDHDPSEGDLRKPACSYGYQPFVFHCPLLHLCPSLTPFLFRFARLFLSVL